MAWNARYADSVKHFPFVFPIKLSDNEIAINIPAHTEPIMFDGNKASHTPSPDCTPGWRYRLAESGSIVLVLVIDIVPYGLVIDFGYSR